MLRYTRLLPLVIFVAALSLTLKVGGMWQDVRLQFRASAASEQTEAKGKANAGKPSAETPPAKGAKKADAAPDTAKAAPGGASSAKPGEKSAEGTTTEKQGADAGATSARTPGTFDPLTATDAEIELLSKLAARREELERRSIELDLRENLLQATERRLEQKLTELKSIKATIEALLKKHDAEEEAKLKSLVKIYENMKPKDAARIYEKLELPILLDVIERMREAKVAPILADMDPAKAKAVTTALAERRNLPKSQANADADAPSLRPN